MIGPVGGRPLAGVRVLDFSHVLAGPYASFMLGTLGAEIIKIERPPGGDSLRDLALRPELDGLPTGFSACNAGKRSLAIDLGCAEGRAVLEQIIPTAHVFIENFRPGKMARLGFGPERVAQLAPDIVYASISAWGQNGELSERGGYDHVMQAATGMMMLQGDAADAPPVKVGFPVIDMATGMLGAFSILAAIMRRRGGETGPIVVDVSMADASLWMMGQMASRWLNDAVAPARVGNNGFTGSPGAAVFRTQDGWICTAANTLAQFDAMCGVLGRPELATSPAYLRVRPDRPGAFLRNLATPALTAALDDAFIAASADMWEQRLNSVGVPASAVRTLDAFLSGPYGLTAGITAAPAGTDSPVLPGAGFRWSGSAPFPSGPAPRLGQDSSDILEEIGMNADQIAALVAGGVIMQADAA